MYNYDVAQDPRMKCLADFDKLHSYISLSSPHLGTQYGESQLVATGKQHNIHVAVIKPLHYHGFL